MDSPDLAGRLLELAVFVLTIAAAFMSGILVGRSLAYRQFDGAMEDIAGEINAKLMAAISSFEKRLRQHESTLSSNIDSYRLDLRTVREQQAKGEAEISSLRDLIEHAEDQRSRLDKIPMLVKEIQHLKDAVNAQADTLERNTTSIVDIEKELEQKDQQGHPPDPLLEEAGRRMDNLAIRADELAEKTRRLEEELQTVRNARGGNLMGPSERQQQALELLGGVQKRQEGSIQELRDAVVSLQRGVEQLETAVLEGSVRVAPAADPWQNAAMPVPLESAPAPVAPGPLNAQGQPAALGDDPMAVLRQLRQGLM